MTLLTPETAWLTWAASYDGDPNPLLALEERTLREHLKLMPGERVVDFATGTGRWLRYALDCQARAVGIDLSFEMLTQASAKPVLRGLLLQGDLLSLPFISGSIDVAICSFALSYVADLPTVMREFSRVARRIIVSDMHPVAMAAGWTRSFRIGGQAFSIQHERHLWKDVLLAANQAGLQQAWAAEAYFEERDRPVFANAGRAAALETVHEIPAVLIAEWRRV